MRSWAVVAVLVAACGPGQAQKTRGGEPAAPAEPDAAPAAVSTPDAGSDLNLAAIEKAVNQTKVGRHLCWEIAAVDGFDLSGTLKLRFSFAGAAPKVEAAHDTTGDPVLARCMIDLYSSYPWPPNMHRSTLEVPFQFGAPRGQYTVGYDRVLAAAKLGAKVGGDKLAGGRLSAWVLLDHANSGNEAASMSALELRDGLDVPLHRHRAAELLYVASGRGLLYGVDRKRRKVQGGDAIYIPAGTPHGFVHQGSEPVKLLQLYAPGGPEQRFKGGSAAGTTPVSVVEAKKLRRSRKLLRAVVTRVDKTRPLVIAGGQGKVRILHEPARSKDAAVSMSVIELAAGASVPAHKHAGSTELLFVRAGKGVMTVDGTRYPVGPGTAIQIPPNLEHAFVASESVTAIQFYTPAGPEQRFKKAKGSK